MSETDDDCTSSEAQEYLALTGARVTMEGNWEYCVKWWEYPDSENSWEPQENLTKSCEDLLKRFWAHIGTDDNDYEPGYEVFASIDWIKKQTAIFKRTHKDYIAKNEKRREEKELQRIENKKKKLQAKKNRTKTVPVVVTKPAKKAGASTSQKKQYVKRSRVVTSESEESDDDIPLSKRQSATTRKSPLEAKINPTTASDTLKAVASTAPQRTDSTIEPPRSPSPAPSEHHSLFSAEEEEGPLALNDSKARSQQLPLIPEPSEVGSQVTTKRDYRGVHRERREKPKTKFVDDNDAAVLLTRQRLGTGNSSVAPPTTSRSNVSLGRLSLNNPLVSTAGTSSRTLPTDTPHDKLRRVESPTVAPQPTTMIDKDVLVELPVDKRMNMEWEDTLASTPNLPQTKFNPLNADPLLSATASFLDTIQLPSNSTSYPTPRIDITSGTPGRIPKKWKWMGSLRVQQTNIKDLICQASVLDAMDAESATAESLKLAYCLTSSEGRLDVRAVPVSHLSILQNACQRPTQFARIQGEDESKGNVDILARYMYRKNLILLGPLLSVDRPVGTMVAIPTINRILLKEFKTPTVLLSGTAFTVVVLPWKLPTDVYHNFTDHLSRKAPPSLPDMESALADSTRALAQTSMKNVNYLRAIHILRIPEWLQEFMAGDHPRPFCIWSDQGNGNDHASDMETRLLRAFISYCPSARDVGHDSSAARITFIHVGALETIHRLPNIMKTKAIAFNQFVTYGTHPMVHPSRWGMHEVYVLGGIITFTPEAIADDVFGICETIHAIHEHPLWSCYVLPAVVGAVAKMVCNGLDPMGEFDAGRLRCEHLLTLIERGEIALTYAPPVARKDGVSEHESSQWITDQVTQMISDTRMLLRSCLEAYEQFQTIGKNDSSRIVAQDLWRMQRQPSILAGYRRYVVIRGEGTQTSVGESLAQEWVLRKDFKFGDTFRGMH